MLPAGLRDERDLSIAVRLGCGAVAGTLGQVRPAGGRRGGGGSASCGHALLRGCCRLGAMPAQHPALARAWCSAASRPILPTSPPACSLSHCVQTLAYPFDVVRRRLQVSGWAGAKNLHAGAPGGAGEAAHGMHAGLAGAGMRWSKGGLSRAATVAAARRRPLPLPPPPAPRVPDEQPSQAPPTPKPPPNPAADHGQAVAYRGMVDCFVRTVRRRCRAGLSGRVLCSTACCLGWAGGLAMHWACTHGGAALLLPGRRQPRRRQRASPSRPAPTAPAPRPPGHTPPPPLPPCCLRQVREEGVQALFKGLAPNYVKVVPSIAIAFVTYEQVGCACCSRRAWLLEGCGQGGLVGAGPPP